MYNPEKTDKSAKIGAILSAVYFYTWVAQSKIPLFLGVPLRVGLCAAMPTCPTGQRWHFRYYP
jgi:hypothetical protein